MIKVIFVSFSFAKGGAAIAASKFRSLLQSRNSEIIVDSVCQKDAGAFQFLKRIISYALVKLQVDGNPIKHSLNLFSYPPVLSSFDENRDGIHHLHWINNDTLSIFDLDKIPTGSVITLHDEWLYCGSEHCYKVTDKSNDFIHGYPFIKKGVYFLNWNYIVWKIKKRKLSSLQGVIYTVPSNWMLERAKASKILGSADIRYLPNPIDTTVFQPATEYVVRKLRQSYSIADDDLLIVFGAIGGKKNLLKGGCFLDEAVAQLSQTICPDLAERLVFVDFGGAEAVTSFHGFRSISVGHINDPIQLANLYSAAQMAVVPSLVESFGQVAAEALSCATPVVCFNTSGLRDIVIHNLTGLVADTCDARSLTEQILTMLNFTQEQRILLGEAGRRHVSEHFSFDVVCQHYLGILQNAAKLKH